MARHATVQSGSRATVTVRLPALLVDLFPGARRDVAVEAASVREVMEELDRLWPGMRDRLCDTRPAIRKHINIFVDGERVTLSTPLAPGATVWVLTAISGG
ncbi:MAG: MoaD/ThiS family protein [Rhizobiaceae bacterium]